MNLKIPNGNEGKAREAVKAKATVLKETGQYQHYAFIHLTCAIYCI